MRITCSIDGNSAISCPWLLREGSVRDVPNVGVLECAKCKLVTHEKDLSSKVDYVEGSMNLWSAGYGESLSKPTRDLKRRVEAIQELTGRYDLEINSVLDFGCGNGEMLLTIANEFEAFGLEPDKNARELASFSGGKEIVVYRNVSEIIEEKRTFDLITLFHVVEHFYQPDIELASISKMLKPGGLLIIETPNSQDALLTRYGNLDFQSFTYWSHHPMLHSHASLAAVVERNQFKILENEGVQRYGLDNHLFWLSVGKPGEHEIWKELFSDDTLKSYEKDQVTNRICDTLWMVAQKIVEPIETSRN